MVLLARQIMTPWIWEIVVFENQKKRKELIIAIVSSVL